MKIKKIVDQCKREKMFVLFDGIDAQTGETFAAQWMGSGNALYPLEGVPYMQKENIYTMFDIPEKQQKKIYFKHEQHLPEIWDFSDTMHGERLAARLEPWIVLDGTGTVIPYNTAEGITFVAKALLEPFEDIQDEVELYERHSENGKLYFAAKNGMLLVGLIWPMNIIHTQFVQQLRNLTNRCQQALDVRDMEQYEAQQQENMFSQDAAEGKPEDEEQE